MTLSVDPGIVSAWLDSTADGAVAVDASGRVVLHNAAASRITGLAPDYALGRPWTEVLPLTPGAVASLWPVVSTGIPTRLVAEVLCAQGNLRSTEILARRWTDSAGQEGAFLLLRDVVLPTAGFGTLVGSDPAMQTLLKTLDSIAGTRVPLLIEGEPGTGKERLAHLLHARSGRGERPLVTVNCHGPPAATLELELFGRASIGEPGSTTVLGRMELAHTGTLVLDRIGGLPPAVQFRLLRLLDAGAFERVDDRASRTVDVRVVALSTQPIDTEVQLGRFREDLFHRLSVVHLTVPPLRDRRGDIPPLVAHFLARYGSPDCSIEPDAMALLQAYTWPGNVRELEIVIQQAALSLPRAGDADAHMIRVDMLSADVRRGEAILLPPYKAKTREEDRRTRMLRALSAHGGNRAAAARALGIGRATFYRWWREVGLA